jgi:antitoxin component of RelBE/YafQ-DinJ toxin-antitoxin module
MAEKTTVAFRVDESVKQEWEDAADSPEYDSLSHLIRLSVQKEIADTETAHTGAQTKVEVAEDSEVLQSLNRIERVVEDVQDEVEAAGRESRAGELYELEQVLLEVLPTAPESYHPGEGDSASIEDANATPHDIAGKIGADTSDVSDALERLEENTAQVRDATRQDTDETYYWRIE